MCRRVTCPTCHKPTFAGCGMHIEQVLGDVAKDDRCHCREKPAKKAGAAEGASADGSSGGLGAALRGLFGK
jgi:GTP cyclohydrolase II